MTDQRGPQAGERGQKAKISKGRGYSLSEEGGKVRNQLEIQGLFRVKPVGVEACSQLLSAHELVATSLPSFTLRLQPG